MSDSRDYLFDRGYELRLEIPSQREVSIRLEQGTAERFGEELPPERDLTFKGPAKFALFTWHGCKLRVSGDPSTPYVTASNVMRDYLTAHAIINKMRYEACRDKRLGPKVVVAGGPSSGKSSVCRILTNYALKCGWRPIFVELDVSANEDMMPGCISASVKSNNPSEQPLAYFFGHTEIRQQNMELYLAQVTELAAAVKQRLANELEYAQNTTPGSFALADNAYASGCIINFPPFIDPSQGEIVLNHIIQQFETSMVFILDQDRLLEALKRRQMQAFTLSKSGGVVMIDQAYKNAATALILDQYFLRNPYQQIILKWDQIKIYKITSAAMPETALTFGAAPLLQGLLQHQVVPSKETILYAVMGVVNDAVDIRKEPVLGVVNVTEVDEVRKEISIISPGELPSMTFILGSLKRLK